MIKIRWFGHSMWQISDGKTTIIIDPFSDIGYTIPKGLTADIVLVSHEHHDHNNVSLIEGDPTIIRKEGSYNYNDVLIELISVWHDENQGRDRGINHLIKITMQNIVILHCGDLGHIPNQSIQNQIKNVNVLMIPVGGIYTIDAKMAANVVDLIKPNIVLPMHYQTDKLAFNLEPLDAFLKIMNNVVMVDKKEIIVTEQLPETTETWVVNYE